MRTLKALRSLFLALIPLYVPGRLSASSNFPPYKVLVFDGIASYTNGAPGFQHASTNTAIPALAQLAASNNFTVLFSNQSSVFTDAGLAPYRVVVFLLTSGEVLNPDQEAAFQRFIEAGNGFVGIHSASDTLYGWPWYGGLIGAYLANHPVIQGARMVMTNLANPSTRYLPPSLVRTDEWYNFSNNPRSNVEVLATLDESSYSGGAMGEDHPIAWCHDYDGGRAWYTAGGHTSTSYDEPLFRAHLLGGIQFAAGAVSFPPPWLGYETNQPGPGMVLTFTNFSAAHFSVLASTNPALPVTQWTRLGQATQAVDWRYEFIDSEANVLRARFYRLRSP